MAKPKRPRATALVVKRGRALLVRHKGNLRYSLPGGGIHKGETSLEAAIRELREETQLRATSAERLPQYDCKRGASIHRVTKVKARGDSVKLRSKEISDYRWWDGSSKIKVKGYVRKIAREAGLFGRAGKRGEQPAVDSSRGMSSG